MIDDARLHPGGVPAVTDDQVPALRRAAALLEQSLVPAPADRIQTMIGKLAIAFPQQRISDAEADVRLEQYAEGLDDVPLDILTAAYKAAIKTRTFFPTVAELRALCTGLALRRWRLSRVNMLLQTYERHGPARLTAQEGEQPRDTGKPERRGTSSMGDAARRVVEQARAAGSGNSREGTEHGA